MARHASSAKRFDAVTQGSAFGRDMAEQLSQFAASVEQHALRSAAYAGAKVLADELEIRVPVHEGVLKDAIYTWHDDKRSRDGQQWYTVGINVSKAPHWSNVEHGHWRYNVVYRSPTGELIPTKRRLPTPQWVPAHPYLRPTADRMGDALEAAKARLAERVQEIKAKGGTI